jgi:hypothetical protein
MCFERRFKMKVYSRVRPIIMLLVLGMLVIIIPVNQPALAAGPTYVAPDGDDSNSCRSPSDPCETINEAINKAKKGDTVYVAHGTYTPLGDGWLEIDKDITLSGGWDNEFTKQDSKSTIDGGEEGNRIGVGRNVTALIDRFVLQYDSGINNYGDLTLTNSTLKYNTACVGGGVWSGEGTSTTIIDSQIYGNKAEEDGGGIYIFTCCDLNSALTLIRSWVVGNTAAASGGGIYVDEGGSATIENSIIAGNYAEGEDADGGGVNFIGSGPYQIINSNIIGNRSDDSGSAIVGRYAEIEVTNTLIIGNTGNTGIDDPGEDGSVITLNYCVTYDNADDGEEPGVIIRRNNCFHAYPMMKGGSLPSWVGVEHAGEWMFYDYRLLSGSPAIDAGDDTACPRTDLDGVTRPQGAACDIGAYEFFEPGTEVIQVEIDIKPGTDPNSINCSADNEVIPVAILTTWYFDATTVDHTTVTFEGASVIHVDKKTGEPYSHEEDVDKDGDLDLIFHFRLGDTGLTCDSTEGELIGETYDGLPITGTDSIRTIPK